MEILDKLQIARASLKAQKEENEGLSKYIIQIKEEANRLVETFKHMHVNNSVDDACKQCGLDLRNPVHFV